MNTRLVHALSALLLVPINSIHGQFVSGTVRDGLTKTELVDATVTLVDTTGRVAGLARTSWKGEFRLRVPDDGPYRISVRQLGFLPSRSPWLELSTREAINYEPLLERLPAELSRVTVRAERDELANTRVLRMDPRTIAGTFVTPTMLATASIGARSYLDVVQHLALPWITTNETCARNTRSGGCLLVFIDDVRAAQSADLDGQRDAQFLVDPTTISHMVLIRGADAGVLFGTGSSNGVLMVYTKGYMWQQQRMYANRKR